MKGLAKAIAMFLFCTLAMMQIPADSWAQTATEPSAGGGTSENPYQISTLGNLYWLSQNSGYWSKCFILTADIDASTTSSWSSGMGFMPIGNSSTRFTGSFNGGGHKISGLTISRSSSPYMGLFGYSKGAIDSLGISDCNITGYMYIGVVVGYNYSSGAINNSYATGIVSGLRYVGGVVGQNDSGSISNCHSTVSVSGTGDQDFGGIVGYNLFGTISNCYTTGRVSGSSYVGGIVGQNAGPVRNCYATGTISGSGGVGGIVGRNSNYDTLRNCHATGNVSGSDGVGGIAGENYYGNINHCYTTGSVSGSTKVGGVAGYFYGTASGTISGTISNSYSTGNVSGTGNHVGGVVGYYYGSTGSLINNSYSTGSVSGSSNVGGILGCNAYNGTINNSYSTGSVSGASNVGGIEGYHEGGDIRSCYATGRMSGTSNVGGVVGYFLNGGYISNCHWDTNTTGQTAGFGYSELPSSFGNCSGLTTYQMKQSANFSGWDFTTVWTIRENNTYPGLRTVENNAPFAFADTCSITTDTFALSRLLLNDYDIETIQQYLVVKVKRASAGSKTDSIRTLLLSASVDTVKYRIGEIRAAAGDTLWGNIATAILTYAAVPRAPDLVSPLDNAVGVSISPRMLWNKVPHTAHYTLQIASDSLFTTIISQDSLLTDTTKTIIGLVVGAKCFWRVNASNAIGAGAWSAVYDFTTGTVANKTNSSIQPSIFNVGISSTGAIKYAISKSSHVSLQCYSMNGKLIYEPVNMQQGTGYYMVNMQRSVVAAGSYLVVFQAGDYHQKKMVFLMK